MCASIGHMVMLPSVSPAPNRQRVPVLKAQQQVVVLSAWPRVQGPRRAQQEIAQNSQERQHRGNPEPEGHVQQHVVRVNGRVLGPPVEEDLPPVDSVPQRSVGDQLRDPVPEP